VTVFADLAHDIITNILLVALKKDLLLTRPVDVGSIERRLSVHLPRRATSLVLAAQIQDFANTIITGNPLFYQQLHKHHIRGHGAYISQVYSLRAPHLGPTPRTYIQAIRQPTRQHPHLLAHHLRDHMYFGRYASSYGRLRYIRNVSRGTDFHIAAIRVGNVGIGVTGAYRATVSDDLDDCLATRKSGMAVRAE
jgi:hypothetical protein